MESVLTPPPPATRPALPGQLTLAYRWIVVVFWVGIVSALGVVAGASEVIGRQVWWLGDDERRRFYLLVLPALAPLATILAAINNRRWVTEASAVATVTTLLTAFGDRHRSPGAATVELALGIAGLLVTVASLAGRYRKPA
jgi:H+/Cl- antiporter ClcA